MVDKTQLEKIEEIILNAACSAIVLNDLNPAEIECLLTDKSQTLRTNVRSAVLLTIREMREIHLNKR